VIWTGQLLPKQRELVSSLAQRLSALSGISAVVLAGSHARGRAFSEAAPFAVQSVRGGVRTSDQIQSPALHL